MPLDHADESNYIAAPRRMDSGRSYVYVLPCIDDSLLKIGFSRDPLQRLRTLKRRFFEFFDLDRGALIETERVRDSRRIERDLCALFDASSAPAPLLVPRSAAGHSEWFRGVHDDAVAAVFEVAAHQGYSVHAPLKPWLRERLRERSQLLYGWSTHVLELIEFERFNPQPDLPQRNSARTQPESALRDALDVCAALGLATESLVPTAVWTWYRSSPGDDRA